MSKEPDPQAGPPRLAYRSRLTALLVVVAVVGAPAVVLRVLCAGHACDEEADASSEVPFCSLSDDLRGPVVNGFRKGRSPEVLAIAGQTRVAGSSQGRPDPDALYPAWPSLEELSRARVPIAFTGPGVSGTVPPGTGLDDIAPTLAESIGLRRKFPEVRSGTEVDEISVSSKPRLLVLVAMKGIGSRDLENDTAPVLEKELEAAGGTTEGTVGSLPLDPAAGITSMGTGGLPRQHGIVGEILRNDEGELVSAWGDGAPVTVIAALGDDLDELLGGRPEIGVAGRSRSDRGLIGGNWYVNVDKDAMSFSGDPVEEAKRFLARDFGRDPVPDLLGVALDGPVGSQDEDLGELIAAADRASDGKYLLAVAGTGSVGADSGFAFDEVKRSVNGSIAGARPIVEAVAPNGLFLDQESLVATELSEDAVIAPLKEMRTAGRPLVVDAFPAVAVSFSQYC